MLASEAEDVIVFYGDFKTGSNAEPEGFESNSDYSFQWILKEIIKIIGK